MTTWYSQFMAKAKVSSEFRKRFSEKLMDLGNLAAGAFIFGQFLSDTGFSLTFLLIGIFLIVSCYIISWLISK